MASVASPAQGADPDLVTSVARRLVILGAGEHARVVADAAATTPGAFTGIRLGDASADPELLASLATAGPDDLPSLVIGFGVPVAARVAASDRFDGHAPWATVIHASAWVSPSARIDPGAVILARAVVNTGATIGRHAIVNSGAIIEHDVVVGAFVHVAPGAVIGGGARIGDRAMIGLGAAVRDHVTIGPDATVAMGAVVVGDVPPGVTVSGVPAAERTA